MKLKLIEIMNLVMFSRNKWLQTVLFLLSFSSSLWAQEKLTRRQQRQMKKCEKSLDFVFIEADTFIVGNDADVVADPIRTDQRPNRWGRTGNFLISKYEVTNKNYRKFIEDLRRTRPELERVYLPDSNVWKEPSQLFNRYTQDYFNNSWYDDFPVVGVSYAMASAYAAWLTKKYNESPDRIFTKVQFRLPTEDEWYRAASGGKDYSVYPWEGFEAVDKNGQRKGNYCTYREYALLMDTSWMRLGNARGLNSNEGATVEYLMVMPNVPFNDEQSSLGPLPVQSFEPNEYGLYNMGGNVEEFVSSVESANVDVDSTMIITKGGSWKDSGYESLIINRQLYDQQSGRNNEIGFRLVMIVEAY